jgi:hypothetical protein
MRATGLLASITIAALGCGGPYHRAPDPAPRISKKPHVEVVVETTPVEVVWDDACAARFSGDPVVAAKQRDVAKGQAAADEGDARIDRADAAADRPPTQLTLLLEAIDEYREALRADNYNADATYGLAVAYAKIRKKGCALEMLERLAELGKNPDLAGARKLEALRDAVDDEPAFDLFRSQVP